MVFPFEVAPSPEYRFGEIIQASPGLSPHGTPAVLRTRKADQSPEGREKGMLGRDVGLLSFTSSKLESAGSYQQ